MNTTTDKIKGIYRIMESQAYMPANCYGGSNYRRIVLVELDEVEYARRVLLGRCPEPKQCNSRHKIIKRIVQEWDRRYDGSTARCAAAKARTEADALLATLG